MAPPKALPARSCCRTQRRDAALPTPSSTRSATDATGVVRPLSKCVRSGQACISSVTPPALMFPWFRPARHDLWSPLPRALPLPLVLHDFLPRPASRQPRCHRRRRPRRPRRCHPATSRRNRCAGVHASLSFLRFPASPPLPALGGFSLPSRCMRDGNYTSTVLFYV